MSARISARISATISARIHVATLAALLALGITAPATAAPLAVHTDLRPLHACLPQARGELLLAGHGGLWRLDRAGRVVQRLTRLSGLPGTRVHALITIGKRIVVGTESGLALLARDAHGALKVIAARAGKPVRALATRGKQLVVGSWGAGVSKVALAAIERGQLPAGTALAGPTGAASLRVTAFGPDAGQALLVATAGAGLWRVSAAKLAPHPASAKLPSRFVWALGQRRRAIVAATLAGLVQLERRGDRDVWSTLSSADVRAISAEPGGALLLGSFGQGLGRLAPGAHARARFTTTSGRFIGALGGDATRRCGGGKQGAFVFRSGAALSTARTLRLGPALRHNDLSALARVGTKLYIGSFDGGLSVLDAGRAKAIAGVDARVDALAVQRRRGKARWLWIGTMRGLYRLDLESSALRRFGSADGLPHEHVHALVALHNGSVVAGTGRGLAIISGKGADRVQAINVKHGLPVASVWALAESRDRYGRALWVGTSKGLYRWSLGRWQPLTRLSVASGHLTDDWITALAVDGDLLYAGTYNAGVVRLEAAKATAKATAQPAKATAQPAKATAKATTKPRVSRRKRLRPRYSSAKLGAGWINFAGLRVVKRDGRSWLLAATMSGLHVTALDVAEPSVRLKALARPAGLGRDVTAVLPTRRGASLWVASRRGLARQPLSILPSYRDPDGC
jgi:hypothetical protein